jgi:SAM-dependent methyltransferase
LERDLFEPNEDLIDGFDFVYSLGLVEHFADTREVVHAIARFARPGGSILTVIPNMCGLMGVLQHLADRAVYLQHARLTPEDLRRAHEADHLSILRCGWFGTYDPAVVNEGRSPLLTERALGCLRLATRTVIWNTIRVLRVAPETRLLSPYVVCVSRRPAVSP